MPFIGRRRRSPSEILADNLFLSTQLPRRVSRMSFWARFTTILAAISLIVFLSHCSLSDPTTAPSTALLVDDSPPEWILEMIETYEGEDPPAEPGVGTNASVAEEMIRWEPTIITDPALVASVRIDALLAQQSRTLEEATSRYTLRNGRAPPPGFDQWFAYAQEHRCLVDEYQQVQRDFEPFYQLARDDPAHFRRMTDLGRRLMDLDPKGMVTIKIENGYVHMPEYRGSAWDGEWRQTLSNFAYILPNMTFLINGRDEPRVVFNTQDPNMRKAGLAISDQQPFRIAPVPTSDFFKSHSGCDALLTEKGFAIDALEDVAFIRSSSTSDFTTDLYPLLSMTKVLSPCFADILFPGQYYYESSAWSGKFSSPDLVPWQEKKPQLYWRGSSNGGTIIHDNHHKFTRFRLIKLARARPDIIDAQMNGWYAEHCQSDCDAWAVMAEYLVSGGFDAREDVYKYKYALDVDGNTFSGRYLGLLRSGSLVFKATAFAEYFNDWLRPYEHYIPVKIDLSDLVEKVEWARAHDKEARQIQQNGMAFARRVITDRQNDCYFAAVLLEWARLLGSDEQGDA
ncbi:unnamed protein product [Mycena citricolor]|uniref:Glycosyl transferase CAP10 domain-containing protein n=1 Tax=Mycena citricolor TaxID=2018698 RepID=A0AAD2JUN4_9AGAR|nr:unnamed protein product [Mycena citricolor]